MHPYPQLHPRTFHPRTFLWAFRPSPPKCEVNLDGVRHFDQWEVLHCHCQGPSGLCVKWPLWLMLWTLWPCLYNLLNFPKLPQEKKRKEKKLWDQQQQRLWRRKKLQFTTSARVGQVGSSCAGVAWWAPATIEGAPEDAEVPTRASWVIDGKSG